jgi:hypothetical protein
MQKVKIYNYQNILFVHIDGEKVAPENIYKDSAGRIISAVYPVVNKFTKARKKY